MDGQVASREDTEAMFSKITGIMDYLRNQLVNNSELAKQVADLQSQVSHLSQQVQEAVGTNSALQEAVNVLTRERDEARTGVDNLKVIINELTEKFNARDNDANHWYSQYTSTVNELEKVKSERSELETEHLLLIENHDKAKDQLKKIRQSLGIVEQESPPAYGPGVVEEVQKMEGPQPRDPVTQQWQSPYKIA